MTKKKIAEKLSKRTQAIHGEFVSEAWEFSHHLIPPLTASTTFRLESLKRGAQGFVDFAGDKKTKKPILIYDRLEEPTTLMLEAQLAKAESAECAISFASGMGAISTAIMAVTSAGQKVLAHKTLYGCTFSLLTQWLPKFNIHTDLIDVNTKSIAKHLADPTVRIVYFETVSNPNLEIIDLAKIMKAVQAENKKRSEANKVLVICDNTFATPWGLRPLEWGVDMVVQSLTKNISGFGTEMGGAVMTSEKYETLLKLARKDFGATITPYTAWHILIYGLSTQALRFEKQQENAMKVAKFLESHSKVASVVYPGLASFPQKALARKQLKSPEGKFCPGTMISFLVKGDMKKCEKFVDDIATHSYTITLAVSLGLNKTLIEVPGYMTHSAIPADQQGHSGIDPRMIRLSIGLESIDDIIGDLKKSLAKI